LVDCWLTSLGNLPSLKKLEHLDLTGNRISDDEIPLLSKYPGLKILRLGYNTLSRMDTLQLLRFAALEQL
jgi:Leucine-rich repeat (LRR) protein